MKKFRHYLAYIAAFALVFTSCSKEENLINDSKTAKLSFVAIINDLLAGNSHNRQSVGHFPACSDDDPDFVRIVLLDENANSVAGTSQNPYRIDLASNQLS